MGLRGADVDLDAAVLRVRQSTSVTYSPGGGAELHTSSPKTTRSRRTADLDPGTVAVLRAHRRAGLEERMMMGGGFTDRDLVFCAPDGSPVNPDMVSRTFHRLVKSSGLPPIRLHDLRHSHATHLLAAGVNPRIVSERLGHATVAFTLDVYGHALPGQHAEAAAAVAALVHGS